MAMIESVEALAARVPDGALVAISKEPFVPMALARALIARQARDLHVVTVPVGRLAVDALIGAGCVATVETSGVSLSEYGQAPFFSAAVKEGRVRVKDATCPAVYAAMQAGEKGAPFIPIRGVIGSDLLKHRPDWKVIQNPFEADEDPIVLLPAIQPDVAVLHVAEADRFGNLWVGGLHHLKTIAHAAKRTVATAERIVEGNLAADPAKAPNLVSDLYVEAVAEAPGGAWPMDAPGFYGIDDAAMRAYAATARSASRGEGGEGWLDVITPAQAKAAQ
ncbi:MAG: CoA-transferase [Pseudomonadota bacterium]